MDRTLKAETGAVQKNSQVLFLFPGALEAEPWEVWTRGEGEGLKCVQVCASPRENPFRKKSTLVLPVSEIFCLPLWLNAAEPQQIAGMIELQLEARGLQRGGVPAVYQWSVVAEEKGRTLVLAGVLPPLLPAELREDAYQAFDAPARYLPLPGNAMILWLEQGRLAVAFTRGTHLVYFQTLGDERCGDRTLQALTCLRASLELQKVIAHLSGIIVWAPLAPGELTALRETCQLPVHEAERPAPQPPAPAWNLCPLEVVAAKKNHEARRWKIRAVLLALAAYVAIVIFLLAQYLMLSRQADALNKWRTEHAAALDTLHQAQHDWQALEDVVDTRIYPLELLRGCAQAIPKDQLHLISFEAVEGQISIRGEATHVTAAYTFFDGLKREPDLAGYTWKMDEPHLLPNDLAQIQLEGSRAPSNP